MFCNKLQKKQLLTCVICEIRLGGDNIPPKASMFFTSASWLVSWFIC